MEATTQCDLRARDYLKSKQFPLCRRYKSEGMCGDAVSHRFAVTIKTNKKKNQRLDVESSDVSVKQMQGVEFRWDFLHYLYFLQACKGEACSAGCQLASACESAHKRRPIYGRRHTSFCRSFITAAVRISAFLPPHLGRCRTQTYTTIKQQPPEAPAASGGGTVALTLVSLARQSLKKVRKVPLHKNLHL